MALVRRPIKQLQLESNYVWLLDFFGGLVENPRDPSQESVECILTPCSPHPHFEGRVQRHLSRQKIGTIGINSLGLVQLGKCVQDGEFVESPIDLHLEKITFRFDARKLSKNNELYVDQVGIADPSLLINKYLSREGVKSAVKLIDGELLKTDREDTRDEDASEDKPYPFKVLFHELEIVRFYYTNSARLNGAVFGGDFSEERLYRHVVSNLHAGPHYELPSRAARFEYQSHFNFDDAILLGRILFADPVTALEGVRRIHLSKLVTRANEVSAVSIAYPRTNFPYGQIATLTLKGRRITTLDRGNLFVVHRIESCNAQFPFADLSFQRVTEPGGDQPPPGAEEAYPNKRTQTGPGQDGGVIDTEARPAKNSVEAPSSPEMRRFTSLVVSRCKTRKDRPSTHTTAEYQPPVFNPALENSSAGTPTWGETNAVRQNVSDEIVGMDGDAELEVQEDEKEEEEEEEKPKLPITSIDLESFKKILDDLRETYGMNSIQPVLIPSTPTGKMEASTGDGLYSFFPVIACAKQKSRDRQFSFLDKYQIYRRRLICVSLMVGGRLFYLFEAERRINDDKKHMELFPILLVWSNYSHNLDIGELQRLLVRTVKNPAKTWPIDISFMGLSQKRIDHDTARTTKVIAKRIVNAIDSVFSQTTSPYQNN